MGNRASLWDEPYGTFSHEGCREGREPLQTDHLIAGLRLDYFVLLRSPRNDGIKKGGHTGPPLQPLCPLCEINNKAVLRLEAVATLGGLSNKE